MPKASTGKRRNPLAKALRYPRYRQRTVKARKGRGSYKRNAKEQAACERGGATEA